MGRGYAHYTRRRVDANQAEIVEALRGVGFSVQSLASLGHGVPDLLVGALGVNVLLEVKDGSLPKSRRELTDDERSWHSKWSGPVEVVETSKQAIEACMRHARRCHD